MAKQKPLRITDSYGNKLTLFNPGKKGKDETLHLEVENIDSYGDASLHCVNLDFIDASELADALVRFARKLKIEYPPLGDEDRPDWGNIETYRSRTVDGCLCEGKLNPSPYTPLNVVTPAWPTDWYNRPQTISTSDQNESRFKVTGIYNGEG